MKGLFLIPLLSVSLYGQNTDLQVEWENIYPGIDPSAYSLGNFIREDISNTIMDSEGNIFVVTNNTDESPQHKNFRLTKFSKTGIRLWQIVQTDSVYPNIQAGAIKVDKMNNIHIAAYAYSHYNYTGKADLVYLKYNPTGQLLWKKRQGNPSPFPYTFIVPKSILFDNLDNAIVYGMVGQFSAIDPGILLEDSMLILKYNPDGELMWAAEDSPDSVSIYNPVGIQLDDSGNVFVGCTHYWYTPGKGHYDYMLIKYNSQGKYIWHRILDINDYYQKPYDLAMDSRGNCYITGYYTYPNNMPNNYVWYTICYDRYGKIKEGLYNDPTFGSYFEYAGLVRTDHNDNVFIAGLRYATGKYYFAVDKYDSSGVFVWEKLFNYRFSPASDLIINQDNSIVFTAVDTLLNQYVVVLDQNGEIIWQKGLKTHPDNNDSPINLTGVQGSNLLVTSLGSGDISDVQLSMYDQSGDTVWNVSMKDFGMHQLKRIVTSPAGELIAVGQVDNGRSDYDFATIKYSTSGLAVWGNRYQGPAGMQDVPEDITLDEKGNVFVAGSSRGSGTGNDFVTIKYDSSGILQWLARYNGPAFLSDEGRYVRVDNGGNVYVTGNSLNAEGNYDIVTVKFNPAGQFQWAKRFSGDEGGFDGVCGLELDKTGNIYVGGTSDSIGELYDYLLIKYDPAGQVKWTRRYNGPGNDGDWAQAMVRDGEDNLYLAGWSVGDGTQVDYAVVKYTPSGENKWVARWDDPASSSEEASAVNVDNNGNVYVTGFSPGAGTGNDMTTVKFDKSGEYQWFVSYDGGSAENDAGYDIVTDLHGDVYVTGSISNNDKIEIVKYDQDGIIQWSESYRNGENLHMPAQMIVNQKGNVFLGGNSASGNVSYWDIVKYNQEGFIPTTIADKKKLPSEEDLLQIYPNPFGLSTTISYSVPAINYVRLTVYNMTGIPVQTFTDEYKPPGIYKVNFSPGNIPDGLYLIQLHTGNYSETRVISLIK